MTVIRTLPVGPEWPHPVASRFVSVDDLRWHVQLFGEGPDVLLLHGAGGASHSWGPMVPFLSGRVRLIVPDLPGQGLTDTPPADRLTLDDYARDLAALLVALDAEPRLLVAHSAGAGVAARLVLDGAVDPIGIVAINPSFGGVRIPFADVSRRLLRPVVRHPDVAGFAAALARHTGITDRLLDSTGSEVPEQTLRVYRQLMGDPKHVRAVLSMMSNWETEALRAAFPRLRHPVLLLSGEDDRWIPRSEVRASAVDLPNAEIRTLSGLGHLAHEEAPRDVAEIIRRWAAAHGLEI